MRKVLMKWWTYLSLVQMRKVLIWVMSCCRVCTAHVHLFCELERYLSGFLLNCVATSHVCYRIVVTGLMCWCQFWMCINRFHAAAIWTFIGIILLRLCILCIIQALLHPMFDFCIPPALPDKSTAYSVKLKDIRHSQVVLVLDRRLYLLVPLCCWFHCYDWQVQRHIVDICVVYWTSPSTCRCHSWLLWDFLWSLHRGGSSAFAFLLENDCRDWFRFLKCLHAMIFSVFRIA